MLACGFDLDSVNIHLAVARTILAHCEGKHDGVSVGAKVDELRCLFAQSMRMRWRMNARAYERLANLFSGSVCSSSGSPQSTRSFFE